MMLVSSCFARPSLLSKMRENALSCAHLTATSLAATDAATQMFSEATGSAEATALGSHTL